MRHYRTHLFVLCALAVIILTGAHEALHNALVDKRFDLLSRNATGNVVLVAIDSRAIEQVGVWPWPRRLHADMIRTLDRAGAADIVFDVDFSAASTVDDDMEFQKALQSAGGSVVLPTFKQMARDSSGKATLFVNRPLPQFRNDSWAATVNVTAGADGLVRRYSYGEVLDGSHHPSLAALIAGQYKPDRNDFVLDFGIRRETVPQFSYIDVLHGQIGADALKGKKVVIGGTAVELGDRFNVPRYGIMSGPMLQVLAAESLLQGRALHSSADALTAGGLIVIVLVMTLLWRRLPAGRRLLVLAGLAIAIESAALVIQAHYPVVLNTALWHAALAVYLVAIALDEIDIRGLLARIADRRFHRITMSVGEGLVCANQKGVITFANPAAGAIFGYATEDLIGKSFDDICCLPGSTGDCVPFSLPDIAADVSQASASKTMEVKGKRPDGETFPLEICISAWSGADGLQYGVVLRDITARKQEEEKIRYLAAYDPLTGLANRNTLSAHLQSKCAGASEEVEVGLLLVGIDRFKDINDTLGHVWGDRVLSAFAATLTASVPDSALVARLGGDVFAVLIAGTDVAQKARSAVDRFCGAQNETALAIDGRKLRVRCSAGVAIYPRDCNSAAQLLADAELAFYRAKGAGGGRGVFFDQSIRSEFESRITLEAELRRAIDRDEFVLFYQPQIHLGTGALVGAEALVRWRHPEKGLVPPGEFIPVVNASSMSDQVGRWVLETACRQGRLWQQQGHAVRIGVNLSPSQIQSGDLPATVAQVLQDTGLSAALLELEVTEDILLADDERARQIFSDIRKLGVNIAFDDFGTGYASLAYLKKFPLDRLKIDRSFVRNLLTDPSDAAIVDSTIRLGKQFGLLVIAEGVEDSPTADMLTRMGCEEGQGYHFGRPMPAEDFERNCLSGTVDYLRAAG